MAQQTVSLGSVANDGTGESLRSGGIKINANFTELYSYVAVPRVINANTGTSLPGSLAGTTIQSAGADNTTNYFLIDSFGSLGLSYTLFRRARGTMAAPSAILANDAIGGNAATGHDGTVYGSSNTTAAALSYIAAENWTSTAHGTYISYYVTKKTTTTLVEQVRLEDAGNLWVAKGNAVVAGGAVVMKFTSAASPIGIYAGSGVPTVSAPQGSLYMRTDGSSTSTRMYVNTNGTTSWTAVTTAT